MCGGGGAGGACAKMVYLEIMTMRYSFGGRVKTVNEIEICGALSARGFLYLCFHNLLFNSWKSFDQQWVIFLFLYDAKENVPKI